MRSYDHFTQEERILLSTLKRRDLTQKEIARELNRNQSSISREFKRNCKPDKDYHAGEAKRIVHERKVQARQSRRRIDNDPWLRRYIIRKLKQYWSPEQIAGRVRIDHSVTVCHETIYQYIYNERPELKKYLRCRKGKYRRRYGTRIREKQREEARKVRIDKRPDIVGQRVRLGDWEGDTVMGSDNSGSLVTYVDRRSGYTLIDYVTRATADEVKNKTIVRFKRLPKQKRHTITYDNGTEFAAFEWIERLTGALVYFAYPYHSWERGTNENTNGLIRQFFPKKSSFKGINESVTSRVERLINARPRKRLGYLTPYEVFVKNMHLS